MRASGWEEGDGIRKCRCREPLADTLRSGPSPKGRFGNTRNTEAARQRGAEEEISKSYFINVRLITVRALFSERDSYILEVFTSIARIRTGMFFPGGIFCQNFRQSFQ
jgi:hypothetical protein